MNTTNTESQRWSDRMQRLGLVIDLSMVALVIINLIWIIFDSLFDFEGVQGILAWAISPAFVSWYDDNIHAWFFAYDLGFVAIFVTELIARWLYAIKHKIYSHWAAYPFIHWYDVLGCIPIGSFRVLRILRIFAVLVRLQRLGIIDYRQWSLYRLFQHWYNILLEELSDRIAVKILEGVQDELHHGKDLERKVVERVILPRKQLLIDSITDRLAHGSKELYGDAKPGLESYIKMIVGEAIHQNMEIGTIEKLPMLGQAVTKILEHAVTDIVCKTIDNGVGSLDRPQFKRIVTEVMESLLDSFTQPEDQSSGAITDALADLVEVIKDEIRVQRWKNDPKQATL